MAKSRYFIDLEEGDTIEFMGVAYDVEVRKAKDWDLVSLTIITEAYKRTVRKTLLLPYNTVVKVLD